MATASTTVAPTTTAAPVAQALYSSGQSLPAVGSAEYATAQKLAASNPPAPIASDTLSSGGASPVTIPPAAPSPTPTTATVSAPNGTTVDANGSAIITPPTTGSSEDTQAWIKSQLQSLGTELGTKSSVETGLQNSADIAGKTQQATSDYNAYNQAKIAQTNTLQEMKQESGGTTTGAAERMAAYTATTNANISNLALQAQISQGLLTDAQKTIDDKISAQFQPVQDQIDFLTKFAQVNDADLTDSEKETMQEKADQLKTDSADVSKFSNDIQTNMAQNKAPQSAFSAIDKITNDFTSGKITAADAKDQIEEAAGAYAGDSYKAAQTAKMNADAIAESVDNGNDSTSIIDGNGNPISVPTSVAPYVGTSANGVNYIDASTLQGTAAQKNKIVNDAQAAGLKVITNKNSVLDLTNIKDANSKLDTATTLLNDISQPDALARDLGGYGLTQLGVLAQTNPKAAVAQSIPIIGLDILKAISGVQGFRGNASAIQAVQDHLPKATDTADVIAGKVQFIQKLLNDRENAIVGTPKTSISKGTTGIIDGKTYVYNGTGDTKDINNWTIQ